MSLKTEDDRYAEEIMLGNLDQLLDEAANLFTKRSTPSQNRILTRSNTIQRISSASINHEQFQTSQTPDIFDMDELINELPDPTAMLIESMTPKSKKSNMPHTFSCQHEYQGHWTGFFAQQKFCDALKAEIQETYPVEVNITKSHDKSNMENPTYIIQFISTDESKANEAEQSFHALFNTVETKLVDDQAGFWVKYPDCVRIVQAYSEQNERLHILCEYAAIGLMISYFNRDKSTVLHNLCITNANLGRILQEKFLSVDIPLPITSDLMKDNKSYLAQEILQLKNELKSQIILMILEQRRVRLFGLVDLVRSVETEIEEIKTKYASNTVKLSLGFEQIKYLLDIYSDELKALETTYKNTKILETLNNREFTAPSYLHDTIEQTIMAMATLRAPYYFEIEDEAFRVVAHMECPNLIKIGRKHKCQIEIREKTTTHIMKIPKATAQDHVSSKLTAAAIKIHKDDLAEQKVDLVVVCSISMYLCEGILEKAGPSVRQEYTEATRLSPTEPFEINSGQLKCRKLLFLPWEIDQRTNEAFYQSIRDFVARAIDHAIKAHHTSIAFPSIGCGKLNVDKNIVANGMLVEAQRQLLSANVLLQIIFVILPKQSEVFDAFQAKLENLKKGHVEIKDTQIPYTLTTLAITVISSNTNKQEECKEVLNGYVEQSVSVLELLQEDTLRKWTQPAINEFYKFCSNQGLVIDMNIQIGYLKLFGSKESVTQAKVEYYRVQAKQSEQARLVAVARNIIWAYQIDDNTSEKYSPELNAHIEDAYSSKYPSFNYTDDQREEYTINFKTMIETCTTTQIQRSVIRHADFNLPEHWIVQSDNIAQFKVDADSNEFRDIRALFDQTMANQYVEIVRIERIQNKPWYTQYSSFKSFFPKKDTERKLFHGCPHESAYLIISSFFNRSFAGVNGTVYGQGAYFSSNARYSHDYAKARTLNGERHMFVATVLVGDSILGNTNMKTPPVGFDSTTDGKHIFVTYRDDQAYAAYLIIYK